MITTIFEMYEYMNTHVNGRELWRKCFWSREKPRHCAVFRNDEYSWAVTGSNRRHLACKASALPSELTALPDHFKGFLSICQIVKIRFKTERRCSTV